MKRAKSIESIALFTTYDQVIASPFGPIWQSCGDDEPDSMPGARAVCKPTLAAIMI